MNFVIYDPETGVILQTKQASAEAMAADPRPWLQVEKFQFDYDVTHRVIDGQLVPIEGATHG